MNKVTLSQGDVLDRLRNLPDESVHCVVTSPPYWGLRDYGSAPEIWDGEPGCEHEWGDYEIKAKHSDDGVIGSTLQGGKSTQSQTQRTNGSAAFCRLCSAWRGSYGLEPTIELYVQHTVEIFREVRRVLRKDGVCFLNLGDSYAGAGAGGGGNRKGNEHGQHDDMVGKRPRVNDGLKPKDLCGVPWRVALALQADGWWLRSDIIWCLSGGTWLYVRTQKGDMPMMVRDVARLDPATVKLWNGKKWTQLQGVSQSNRQGDEIEMVLRSGERISCTPTHQWPTGRGLLLAADIQIGDVLDSAYLPEPEKPKDCVLDEDAAWFAGLYIAEGSKAGDTIQIAGHSKEKDRLERVKRIAAKFGGSATVTVKGNKQDIRAYGKVLNAILDELVTGRTAKDKGFSPVVWRYSNRFIAAIIDGYLSGDGHWDEPNNRWRLGFTRNYNLERDIRVACARLGYRLVLNLSTVKYDGRRVPTFRGELRKSWTAHHNQKKLNEVVKISKSRCRNVYDLGVEDAPNLFALASGVLTHNSKPNPMPESVTDRPTRSHEYIFLLTKSAKYFWDAEAVRENFADKRMGNPSTNGFRKYAPGDRNDAGRPMAWNEDGTQTGRNVRSVWNIATAPFPEAHFATFPPSLVEKCIAAGTSEKGVCPKCGMPWVRVVEKKKTFESGSGKSGNPISGKNGPNCQGGGDTGDIRKGPCLSTQTLGFRPSCKCADNQPIPATVLDPFSGSGTTCLVAAKLGRDSIGIELKLEYLDMATQRLKREMGFLIDLEIMAPSAAPGEAISPESDKEPLREKEHYHA